MNDLSALLEKIRVYRPDFEEGKIKEAFEFAKKAHTGQWRKTGEPYFTHVYKTALFLTELRADDETICAALLHDAVEDATVTFTEIKSRFGETVAKLVQGVTKVSKVKYQDRMAERQIVSLRKMFVSMADDLRVIIIKLADRLHNMQTLHGVRPDKQLRIARETLEIYCPLANLLGIWYLRWQLEDLCFKYLNSTEYQKIDRFFGEYKEGSEEYIEHLKKTVAEKMRNSGIDCFVEGRSKHYYSIYQKLQKQKRKPEDVYDIFALRVIVHDREECYKALGIIHSLWKPRFNRFKDYISVPKSNGYQSIHTTVFGPSGKNVEIQIRTSKMHEEAEFGVAAHWFYKHELSPQRLKKTDWITQLLHLQKAQKDNLDFVENLKVDILHDRIFVFTPRGEIVDLPKGATVLDFAYAIHSDIGNHFNNAYVNGVKSTANNALETGDTVEVETSENSSPDLSWIKYAKTGRASESIRSYLRKETKENKAQMGEKLLRKILQRMGKDELHKFLHHKNYLPTLKRYNIQSDQALYKAICEELIDPAEFVEKVYARGNRLPALFMLKKDQNVLNREADLVSVEISGRDRIGILGDIASTISNENVNIASFKVLALYDASRFYYVARLEIPNFEVLENVFEKLEQVDSVEVVRRVVHPYSGLFLKAAVPFLLLVAHAVLLNYLKSDPFFFYLSFLIPAYALWKVNRLADNQTGFYLNKTESFALTIMITFAGFFFCYWELYYYSITHDRFELYYLLALLTPYLLLKASYHLFQYVGKRGRTGLLLSNRLKKRRFIKNKLLKPDPGRYRYKRMSIAYEKYLLDIYQKNYLQNNCWHEHYTKIHDQINLLIGGGEDLKDKVVAIIGCGPEPGDRDFSPHLLNLLRKGLIKKVVLIDFSKNILVAAIDNLIKKGVDPARIRAYQIDLTKGYSAKFASLMASSKERGYEKTLEEMHKIIEAPITAGPELPEIMEEDRFDFFISSMFATATLVPVVNRCIRKFLTDRNVSPEQRERIMVLCHDFHRKYNSMMVELSTSLIIGMGKNNQRGLIISDTEKIYKGNKEVQNVVHIPISDSLRKDPGVKDIQLYHWIWQDESDHYHTIQSLILDIKKAQFPLTEEDKLS